MKSPSKSRIVATICLDESDEIVKVLPGNACLIAHQPGEFKTFDYISILVTAADLEKLNQAAASL